MKNKDYKKLLNLNFLDITNQTYACGKYDLPYIYCKDVNIDYIALYPNLKEYNKTTGTAVGFYVYDFKFDGKNGLFRLFIMTMERAKKSLSKDLGMLNMRLLRIILCVETYL